MKMHHVQRFLATTLPALMGLILALAASARANDTATEYPSVVPFELGDAEFAPGDSITIQSVRGTSPTIRTGETYCVEGTYTLASKDAADLALYATTRARVSSRTEPSQLMHIEKGSGTFRLVKPMREEGYLHVSFYPAKGGGAFGGVYFGQGEWVLHHKGWSYLKPPAHSPDYTGAGGTTGGPVSLSGPNRALLEYLGDPVEAPADMDAAYSKDGLIKAVQTAAANAGISLKRVEIDDSEFPFLVGVVCKEGDYDKLTAQLRKLDGYAYTGSVSSSSHAAFNLVPYQAFPPGAGDRIGRRSIVREGMLYHRIERLD